MLVEHRPTEAISVPYVGLTEACELLMALLAPFRSDLRRFSIRAAGRRRTIREASTANEHTPRLEHHRRTPKRL